MRGTLVARGSLSLLVLLVGLAGVMGLLAFAPTARGQAVLYPYPGSQPVKRAVGA